MCISGPAAFCGYKAQLPPAHTQLTPECLLQLPTSKPAHCSTHQNPNSVILKQMQPELLLISVTRGKINAHSEMGQREKKAALYDASLFLPWVLEHFFRRIWQENQLT